MFQQVLAAYVVAFAAMGACGLVALTIGVIVRHGGTIGEEADH